MRTLLRIDSSFSTNPFRLSTNSSQSSLHKPAMTKSRSSSTKKWFTPSFHTSSSKKKPSRTTTSLPTQSTSQPPFQQPSPPPRSQSRPQSPFQDPISSSQPTPQSQPQDRPPPPTYTTSLPMPSQSQQLSKRQKAWKKTKEFLSSIGEPPTAEYERQQAALSAKKGKIKTSGREAFGAVNYGPYHQGGPYGQGGRL